MLENEVRLVKKLVRDRFRKGLLFAKSQIPFSVGIGLTKTPGDYKLAIRLPHQFARFHLIEVMSILFPIRNQVDIQVIGKVTASALPADAIHTAARLSVGTPIRHHVGRGGTLGFFARRDLDQRLGIVSCNHVLARLDRGNSLDRIDGPSGPIAKLDGSYPRLREAGDRLADCAFAAFDDPPPAFNASALDGNRKLVVTPAVVQDQLKVMKIGRRTDFTAGVVVAKELDDFPIVFEDGTEIRFDDVIHIQSENGQPFSDEGDSGSLVYSAASSQVGQPVGLLFGNSPGHAFANPIEHVTSKLHVTLVV